MLPFIEICNQSEADVRRVARRASTSSAKRARSGDILAV